MSTLVHVSAEDGLLESASRVRRAQGTDELVLIVPEGAPVLLNPLFLRTLREIHPGRPVALVTPDLRGRAIASGIRLPAYASVAAYEEKSVDPTEQLERARVEAIAGIGRERARRRARRFRLVAALIALLLLALTVGPSAQVIVAADVVPIGPIEARIATGAPGGVSATRFVGQVSGKVTGIASGARYTRTRATGTVTFQNGTTDAVTIPAGTIVSTPASQGGVQFRTTQTKTLPASSIIPFFFFGTVDVPIEAVVEGPSGNVDAGAIKQASGRMSVKNTQPTSGGSETRIAIVQIGDYNAASARLDQAIDAQAKDKMREWAATLGPDLRIEDAYASRGIDRTASVDIVGMEGHDTFDLAATVEITAFAVASDEPTGPRGAGLRALAELLRPGYELVPELSHADVKAVSASAGGLTWVVTAEGKQRPKLDSVDLQLALAGQDRQGARTVLAARGMTLDELHAFPSWWPRLPVLPLRIDVRSAAGATGGP